MRVTFLVANYAPSVGGAQTYVRRLAEGLVGRGHDVSVVTSDALLSPGGPDPGRIPGRRDTIGGVDVERYPVDHRFQAGLRLARRIGKRFGRPIVPSVPAMGPWGLRLAAGAARAVRAADVVVAVSAPYTTIPAADLFRRGAAAAFVAAPLLHLEHWSPGRAVLGPLRRADRCVVSTAFEADWLRDRGVRADRLLVVPPGSDGPHDPPPGPPAAARAALGLPERPTVAYVGRLSATKGVDTLLAALPALLRRRPDVGLVLAGGRTGWAGLDPLLAACEREHPGRVVVRHDFAEAERPLLYEAGDVVAFPSRDESFGMVILEAWAAGRPVVAADTGAVRSTVRAGVDGELVPVGDADALATALSGLLDDPARAAAMGRAGSDRLAAEFAWDDVIERWDGVVTDAGRSVVAAAR